MPNLQTHGFPNPGGANARFNPLGGVDHAFVMDENVTRGDVVEVGATDMQMKKIAVDSDKPVGTVFDVSVSAGEKAWITTDGVGYIKPESGVTATRGDVCFSSDAEAGTCDMQAAVPAATRHFREIGHALEDGSGAGAVVRGIIHQN